MGSSSDFLACSSLGLALVSCGISGGSGSAADGGGVPIPSAPANVNGGSEPVYAVFDDTTRPHPSWYEYNTTNNTSAGVEPHCGVPN
jgi:hypothetical protein